MNSKLKILLALVILLLFTLSLFIVFGDNGLADLKNLKQKRDKLIAENKSLAQENNDLKRIIKRLRAEDPALIERVAREELNMVGKDEKILMRHKSD